MTDEDLRRIELQLETIARSLSQLTDAVVRATELLSEHLERQKARGD